MPEFSLCLNPDCGNRRTCRRGCTLPDPLQQRTTLFRPDASTGWCEFFMAVGRGNGGADAQV